MNKTKISYFFFLLSFVFAYHTFCIYGQQSQGTSKYQGTKTNAEVLPLQENWDKPPPEVFSKPETSIKEFVGHAVPYSLWVDPYTWHEIENFNSSADETFQNTKGDIFAFTVIYKEPIDLSKVREIMIKDANESGLSKISVISEKDYVVNGCTVLALHWKAILHGIDVDFLSYILTSNDGTVILHSYTPSVLLNKNIEIMKNLLNGLTIRTG